MAHRDVEIAVEARLRAEWNSCPVFVENTTYETPADGSPFVILQFPVANTERWPVSHRVYREEGAFRLVLHVPSGTGVETIRDWGEALAVVFCDQSFAGVNCRTPQSPFIDDGGPEGPYIWASIAVPYDFSFSRA